MTNTPETEGGVRTDLVIPSLGVSWGELDEILRREDQWRVDLTSYDSQPWAESNLQRLEGFFSQFDQIVDDFEIGNNWPDQTESASTIGHADSFYLGTEHGIKYSELVASRRRYETFGRAMYEFAFWALPMESADDVECTVKMKMRSPAGYLLSFTTQGTSWTDRAYELKSTGELVDAADIEDPKYDEEDIKTELGVGIKLEPDVVIEKAELKDE